ncbi:hypothetical protein SCATT_05060 [Streptantibioticus cattleyicolor NRRL 8057 = DSM 46488]|uniref:Uncharacterized protein n=1 Tax=Streptantibioticus cattleyicolor (strain ATCC 35852 / DSM 46488 / JCM 4925 / NBRC 14057 / NRRL 8057) TaxID=1003195 RepID=G8WPT9_STREN|nr:hypothetical protein SCATT_05060 [Streptantibioticus cattleyicolor NRRL 8057 = DSM 46488]
MRCRRRFLGDFSDEVLDLCRSREGFLTIAGGCDSFRDRCRSIVAAAERDLCDHRGGTVTPCGPE